ncbi:unnamed protein product [Diabrotica balteata]|uniref:Uncharacterized protein n=1 Tax=Diabrotica balteata TaxID=107213 RepID=A0A9N9T0K0_DIABA|nr:unnamed protein product [Diabrotica balteata]
MFAYSEILVTGKLENDMENYIKFKLMGGQKKMKLNVVPHIFNCQPDRKRAHSHYPRITALKRVKHHLIEDAVASTSSQPSECFGSILQNDIDTLKIDSVIKTNQKSDISTQTHIKFRSKSVQCKLDCSDSIKGRKLDRFSRSMKLSKLFPDTKYLICVLALGNWAFNFKEAPQYLRRPENDTNDMELFSDIIRPLLVDSPTSRCAEVNTLGAPDSMHVGMGMLPDHSMGAQSILTRRLGLIIGCCMGFVVFVGLVSILGYLKIKKQRRAVKRDQPLPPEYLSYRHFSIQSGEAGGHPHFITNMNTTVLN